MVTGVCMLSVNVSVQTALFCQKCSAQQQRESVETEKRTHITERIIRCQTPNRHVRLSCGVQEHNCIPIPHVTCTLGQILSCHLLMLAEIFKLVNG